MNTLGILGMQSAGCAMSADEKFELVSSIDFPHPELSLAEGIVAVGGKLDVGTLFHAYAMGIFPWPHPDYPLLWFCPEQRGVIHFSEWHLSRSYVKFLKKHHQDFRITINHAFDKVVKNCQMQNRKGQDGTWITDQILSAYAEFHKKGFAHSIEVWKGDSLVGGLYGVEVLGVFSGESMFHRVDNASKMALHHAIEWLQQRGHKWMDIQMVTPVTESFGGKYISRKQYLDWLDQRHEDLGYFSELQE